MRSPAPQSSLEIYRAGSICRKLAEPGKIRKEGERSGDVHVPGAWVSGLGVLFCFVFFQE